MLGYPNFIQLGYDRLGRNCYGQKELAAFRDQIANDLVPVIAEVKEAQRKRIGVDRLYIYDDKFRFPDGNPAPEGTAEEILAAGAECMRSSAGDEGIHRLPLRQRAARRALPRGQGPRRLLYDV